MKRRSEEITGRKDGAKWVERTAARTMLRAVRFTDEDFDKPIIALAVPYTNGTPCNDHVRVLGDIVQKAIEDAGGKAIVFGTPVVSGRQYRTDDRRLPGGCRYHPLRL
jgi:dihydroxy-acid dehydratase